MNIPKIFLPSLPACLQSSHSANERTFLGYLRSGQAFSMLGVFIAQLLRLNPAPHPNPRIGFFAVSVPLASACQIMAIIVTLIGSMRFIKYQKHMALGLALSGGWEVGVVGSLTMMVRKPRCVTGTY